MGYTNYWKRNANLPAKAFAEAVGDCTTLMTHIGVPLAGGDGTGSPTFRAGLIEFNGVAPEEYETFRVEKSNTARRGDAKVFEFCKTNERPYDLAVQCSLIVLKHYLGEAIIVSSDGNESYWENARAACQKLLGYGGTFRLEE